MMDSKAYVLDAMRDTGASRAKTLRESAESMTGTEIIAQEDYIPDWRSDADYSAAPVGAPVQHDGQVYKLLQPHNAAHYPGTIPATLPALWRVTHTMDPKKAKPWAQPTSTSDMYLAGEYMVWTDGETYRCKSDTGYSPAEYAAAWESSVGGDQTAAGTETGSETETETETTYPEWTQPTGAHDAYNVGDVVSYNGKVYKSLIAANVYSPEAYPAGWQEVTA